MLVLTHATMLSSTLEDVLVHTDSALRDMMPLLVRSDLLLDDIQVHLDAIMSSRGASVLELDHTAEDDAEPYHRCITSLVIAAQASLQRSKLVRTSSLLTRDHIALLSTRQARAVQSYLNQVISLRGIGSKDCNLSRYDEGISFTPLTASPSEKSDGLSSFLPRPTLSSTRQISKTLDSHLVLAHAYVRYMGDLSGGQHIVKRLSKLFPIYHFDFDIVSDAPQGFRFYSFTSTGKSNSALKDMIRIRLDALDLSQWDKQLIVDEASQAFLLNGQLLDSLVDEVDSTSIAMEMARSQPRISSLPSHAAMLLSSLHLHHPHTLALIAASLLCAGLASALYVSAF